MTEIDPVWLALVLGAYANIQPTSFITVRHGEQDPDKSYYHLKQVIRDIGPNNVDILDIGPGSAERRQILANQLKEHEVISDPEVRRWAVMLLESVIKNYPRLIKSAGFSNDDVRNALLSLKLKGVPVI